MVEFFVRRVAGRGPPAPSVRPRQINFIVELLGLSRRWRCDRWRAAATGALGVGARREQGGRAGRHPTLSELFIALKPLTYFAATPPRKVTDPACSLPARRHCLSNRAAALIKVVDTQPLDDCTQNASPHRIGLQMDGSCAS